VIRAIGLPVDDRWWVRAALAGLTVTASFGGGAAILAGRGSSRRPWRLFLGGALVALTAAVSLWFVVSAVRTSYL
jgi:hypothetical protein